MKNVYHVESFSLSSVYFANIQCNVQMNKCRFKVVFGVTSNLINVGSK